MEARSDRPCSETSGLTKGAGVADGTLRSFSRRVCGIGNSACAPAVERVTTVSFSRVAPRAARRAKLDVAASEECSIFSRKNQQCRLVPRSVK